MCPNVSRGSEVERGDLVLALADDDVAAQLEARRQLAALLGPVVREHDVLADRLSLGHRLVGVLDGLVQLGAQVGVVDEANAAVSKAEAIRKFVVLPTEWTEEGGQLTPSLKLKRTVVMREFREDVAALYDR